MLRSLRGRLIGAFVGVILLASVLNGALAIWTTINRFNFLATEEGRWRAQGIAALIEAQFADRDSAPNLAELFSAQESGAQSPAVADLLGLPDDRSGQAYRKDNGPANDPLSHEYGGPTGVLGGADCAAVAAKLLGLPVANLYAELDRGRSVADVAAGKGIAPTAVVTAIVIADEQSLPASERLLPESRKQTINHIIYNARSFVYGKQPAPDASGNATSPRLVTDAHAQALLFGDERLLVADTDGRVIYDSTDQQNDAQLPQALLDQGVLLWNFAQNRPLGTVIIAAGPGFYTSQQMTFLHGVSWSLLISGLLAGGIALVVGVQLARRIVAPVAALTQGLRRLAAGNWADRLPIRSDDEFGQMSGAFNTMADALQTQKMLRNRLVDDLMHELNTPLSVIQLELEAMRDGMQSPAQATEQLQREIMLLRNLINDLAVLAESEQDAEAFAIERVDMRELIAQAVARWQSNAEAKGVRLMVEVPDLPLFVQADPLRISQVLGNLLNNALRYTDTDGRVTLACRRLTRRDLNAEQAVRIMPSGSPECIVTTIADTGCGIPAKDLPFVFERFYTADTARNRARSGRGLGLAIVRQIVERHSGNVWVDSQLQAGSSFGFSLASPD
jgi:signal transduction histidine kinase